VPFIVHPSVRQATKADIPAIFAVRYAVHENTLRPGIITHEDVRLQIEESGRGWVVESQGRIVAFAIGNAANANVWALFVGPESEHQGYGQQLHAVMVKWLRSCGCGTLWLTTGAQTRARSFYERLGWQYAGVAEHNQVRLELSK
jgi:GNAT superfamily N-acetyltransferase